MQLFKRVLLSLFPDEIITQNVNPASMFVSFISTKEFFSVINRKIVENYKLNLFDIGLDPFEFKVGFGSKPSIKLKHLDLYYSYCSTANLNGYRFLNPSNLSSGVALVSSVYVKDIFNKYPPVYYLNFVYTVYLLSFVFITHIKNFPNKNKQEDYNRFIEVFFEFYKFVFNQTNEKLSPKTFTEIKKKLINEVDLFFMLHAFYQRLQNTFQYEDIDDEEFFSWIFYEELQKNQYKILIKDFIKNNKEYSHKTKFSLSEKKLLSLVLPADILLRYIFLNADMFLITQHVTNKIYDKEKLDNYLKSFRKNDDEIESFLLYITDYKNFKQNFFKGVQKYIVNTFSELDEEELKMDIDDLDEMMSSIGNDLENLESFKVPERIKKESKMMEKILNFYITLIGGFRVARGDSFFSRVFRKPLIKEILNYKYPEKETQGTINYYGSLLYNYGKNVFYYKYASDNVRSGKQKFYVPYKSNGKNVYSNTYILKLLDENFVTTILQDINPKDIRIYVKNKKILDIFKSKFSHSISQQLQKNDKDFITFVYEDLDKSLGQIKNLNNIIIKHLSQNDIYQLKENIYNLDFWIAKLVYKELTQIKVILNETYSDTSLLGIFSYIRETFFGFCLYLTYLKNEESLNKKKYKTNILREIYLNDVLNITEDCKDSIKIILQKVYIEFKDIFEQRISMDDNEQYFFIALENWTSFTDNQVEAVIFKKIIGEDIIRFRGFLKNISYYNKRFLIPK